MAFTAVALISVLIVALLGVGLLRLTADRIAREELRRQARTLSSEPAFLRQDPDRSRLGQRRLVFKILRRWSNLSGAVLYRLTPDGRLVLEAGTDSEGVPAKVLDAEDLAAGQTVEGRFHGPDGDVVYVAQPVETGSGRAVVVLSRQAGVGHLLAGPLANRLLLAALIAAAVGGVLAAYLSRRIARPLRELAWAAAGVARGDFDRRVSASSDDEIAVLASSFNRMARELGDADRRQREFFLSISHELRTPLTAIQGYAEAIEDGTVSGDGHAEAARVIGNESRRLARLVADLLDLARIDARRFQVSVGDVDVDSVLRDTQRAFAPKAVDAGVEIAVDSAGGRVRADHDRLVQVLSNLVENGLRYTPSGKRILLSSAQADGSLEIRVTDGGPGLDPDDLPHAFDRQYLWGKYRGLRDVGSGLGLAITRELVEAMGGSVHAANVPGAGAQFTIKLPRR